MSMELVRWAGFACGIALVLVTTMQMINTLIVPRRVPSRVLKIVLRVLRAVMIWLASRSSDYQHKDHVLAYQGPVGLMAVLGTWLLLFFLAFALILWPLIDGSFVQALRESGSSLLTLGIAAGDEPSATFVYFYAGATGLVTVALMIAYIPTLYDSFNRRELLVTMLQSRAGVPAWGPEILARHQLSGLISNFSPFYAEWEQWSADVAETHTSYPLLLVFRSPHPLRSWIVGLLAVLDSAAMYNALCPGSSPVQARLCLRMGFICLRDIADALGIPYDPDPFPDDPIELTYEEFHAAVERIQDVGFPVERSVEEAWVHFHGWRINYEQIAYAVADYLIAPPAPWSGERTHLPNLEIVPRRPPDRRAGDPNAKETPKTDRLSWRLRG